jgi:hypothetical protein
MMMLLTGRLPKLADCDGAAWEGWHFEIVDMDGKTLIDKALAWRDCCGL